MFVTCRRAKNPLRSLFVVLTLLLGHAALGQTDDRLIGIWTLDEGFQIVELLFRPDGHYHHDQRSTDPNFPSAFSDPGSYTANGGMLRLAPFDYLGDPISREYEYEIAGDSLLLLAPDQIDPVSYQFKPGSRQDVLARQNVPHVLIGTWGRKIAFAGGEELTFRPGDYYFAKSLPEEGQFPPEYIRGRYATTGDQLSFRPYNLVGSSPAIDFFGNLLTLIQTNSLSGQSRIYTNLPGSETLVRAKAAEGETFLSRSNWQVGTWEIRDGVNVVDLTFRPDGHYFATNDTPILRGIVRGRYVLEPRRIHLEPFPGQGLYSPDNGEFGKVPRARVLDYYDGELQLIDTEAISQRISLARKRTGSEASILTKAQQASMERGRNGWQVGVWEVNDPVGWMEFTFRPDQRYIAKSGTDRVPSRAERGRYVIRGDKVTLAPYAGLGPARGFELDLFDGDLFLAGDVLRLVVARKLAGSESSVIDKTRHPESLQGERGTILGLWTANTPGASVELVFRADDQFRLSRCANNVTTYDYGLYAVNMVTRSLVYDSRLAPVNTPSLDFYGNTLTLHDGGMAPPNTYTVNLGRVDASIAASLAADAEEARIDAQWLARIPIGPRDPNAVQIPTGDIPGDPNPGNLFNQPTVFTGYHLYRRLIPGLVFFSVDGAIRSVPVTNTREWHFFPTGRAFVRFKNHFAGVSFPLTIEDVSTSWHAYRIEPKPVQRDILHLYADNVVFMRSDGGEQNELTLEDGRRHLFLEKDFLILSEWATEQMPIPCLVPPGADASLANTGVSLATTIEPDDTRDPLPIILRIATVTGGFTLRGTVGSPANIVVERALRLASPTVWQPIQTNAIPVGAFALPIPRGANEASFFRLRRD